jgi:urease accessory protein
MTTIAIDAGAGGYANLHLEAGLLVPRVVATTSTSAHVAIVAGGALLLGGDKVDISVLVGSGCRLELEDVGGTIAYDADGAQSTWNVRIDVAANAELIWHGLPFVVSTGANVSRTTVLTLAPSGRSCVRETIVLGRAGETGGRIESRTSICRDGHILFAEHLVVDGNVRTPGVMGNNRVLDSILLMGSSAPPADSETVVLELDQGGSIARMLGGELHRSNLDSTWQMWRQFVLRNDLQPRDSEAVATRPVLASTAGELL